MDSETLEHTCYDYVDFDDSMPYCKLCVQLMEERKRKKLHERDEKRKNCLAQRTEKYSQDFDEWSEEDIEKMEEKFKKFERLIQPTLFRGKTPERMIVQLDDNVEEYEYWIKRYQNECEKVMHNDPDCDSDLMNTISKYLEAANRDCTRKKLTCLCHE